MLIVAGKEQYTITTEPDTVNQTINLKLLLLKLYTRLSHS